MSRTITLADALAAWGTPHFASTLKRQLEQLNPAAFPLQEALSQGSHVSTSPLQVVILALHESDHAIHARIGIHYQSTIAGCSCADDPAPGDELNEYCQAMITIGKTSASASIQLLDE